ncbi:MAG: 16S rRNA (adenine(1518)-N(6)/adenine(1519)-N(6))-dimethyltransferase RsmA [Magnetococcales bacterium]|nr:16S rRNA (adenine(1518)-N(6)/adenine(1519)-N(6))-dimethyltransferase RsmA [Magnetococcales bacterium]
MSSIVAFLKARGVQPNRRLGQNFLVDEGTSRRIAQASGASPEARVVEIGPGAGSLTLPLLELAGRVTVIEKDRTLTPLLRERVAGVGELTLLEADALTVDYLQLAETLGGPLTLAANLPYNISTPILLHLLEQRRAFQSMTLMFQKEVATRLTAPPGGKEYGILSVYCACWTLPRRVMTLPPGAFYPAPQVDSAVVRFDILAEPPFPMTDESLFRQVVRAAFAQRRKTLGNALSALADDARARLLAAGIDPMRRAETLSAAEFAHLARSWQEAALGENPDGFFGGGRVV